MSKLLHDIKLIGDDIPWLKDMRSAGRDAFAVSGIPQPKAEAWKYTKPIRFFAEDFTPAPRGEGCLNPNKNLPFNACKIYFENGVFSSCDDDLPQGVEVLPLIEAIMFKPEIRGKIGALADVSKHPFAALNQAYLGEGVYIKVAAGTKVEKPLAIINHITADQELRQHSLRNLVIMDDSSQAEIMEYYCYDGELKSSYFVNMVNEIYISENASLHHYKLQSEAYKAAHIALNSVFVAASGEYKSFCLQKGADLSRNETKVILSAEYAKAEVDAAYIMNGWATIDTTTDIEHLKPFTQSSQLVKGVIGGQAKGVFQGKIHIAPQAVKTEGYQLHKAMLLSDEAEIDVKPELEIFADDVKCSHGAASGELNADQLFYMRSRGIGEEEARQILIDAYLNDVIAKIDNQEIRQFMSMAANPLKERE